MTPARALRTLLAALGLVFTIAVTPSAAITVSEIVALSKAGVSEAVILALLDRDQTILTIEPEQVVALKREGLSDRLIVAMLQNGREAGEIAARAVSDSQVAAILANPTISSITPGPNLVIVGQSADRPNTSYSSSFHRSPRGVTVFRGADFAIDPYVAPYASPYMAPHVAPFKRGYSSRQFDRGYREDPVLCLAQVNTARGMGPSYVTECPAVMQPHR